MIAITAGAALLLALAAPTTETAPTPAPDALASLAPLEGRLEGEGWMRRGPGEPQRFRGKEIVERRLDGKLLTVEGIHRSGEPEHVVHHAFAIIAPKADRLRFLSFLADGRSGDYDAELKDGTFVWGFENSEQGRVRFSISIKQDQWHEVGEASRDGAHWFQFFEMTLHRSQ